MTDSDKLDKILKKIEVLPDLQQKVRVIALEIENRIIPSIDVVAEGHGYLVKKLDEALRIEKSREEMALKIIYLESEMNKIKDKIEMK